ncbi:MAG: putative metal-binding motif-containing protein [Alphaproteobacteria bacterium]|nr:putative metal-binding motif-containing protein [Alphaproteobacteria bacterium]
MRRPGRRPARGGCDGAVDEGSVPAWYLDADGDGDGNTALVTHACDAPTPQHVGTPSDCNDAQANVHPEAAEACDSVDNDRPAVGATASSTRGARAATRPARL